MEKGHIPSKIKRNAGSFSNPQDKLFEKYNINPEQVKDIKLMSLPCDFLLNADQNKNNGKG